MTISERYDGTQSMLLRMGATGCYFLSLCSIAEEYTGLNIDILGAAKDCLRKKLIQRDFFVMNPCEVLRLLTWRTWTLDTKNELPTVAPDEMYTVEKWRYGDETHFKRRFVDTIEGGANTVKKGFRESFYCFTVH